VERGNRNSNALATACTFVHFSFFGNRITQIIVVFFSFSRTQNQIDSKFEPNRHQSTSNCKRMQPTKQCPCLPPPVNQLSLTFRTERRHLGTKLFGLVPLPKWMVHLDTRLAEHGDGNGWDLDLSVSLLCGRVTLIRYAGPVRVLPDDTITNRHFSSTGAANNKAVGLDHLGSNQTGRRKQEPMENNLSPEQCHAPVIVGNGLAPRRQPPSPPLYPENNFANVSPSVARYVPGFHEVVLFDGECTICNSSVDFLLRHDRDERFIFATQQSASGKQLLNDAGQLLPSGSIASRYFATVTLKQRN
jgi:hypothetical protein